ncbi:ferulic acid esterase (FaeA), putative [Talaromyces stipitatus ATCC 10500]|uniref:feruloyl esterase n=1 Tax=Talaromyces stipitatus (strain ATCC 10500 / CBS 375.48 / QM 6759 / NRRL 1006) TaxID=441959 RepID=B8LWX8_TALSN|nr:ferulic acid esterase (FaeA), putative [Talaromyces stipitatus ATCC 10500]EED24611.1 ferulic acid esterase (FaeA), putative [Talaromyces stipitatus ATCC 10500]
MSHLFTDSIRLITASISDAVGLIYSGIIKILAGDVLSPRRLARMLFELVLGGLLLIAPAITDVQFLLSSNRTRSYWVHAPDNFQSGQTYPAVILFHGSGRLGSDADGLAMELDLRLSLPLVQTAYSADKYFIYPNGVGGAWAGPSYAEVSVPEDLQFVSDMINDLKSKYSIDSNRIYAAGMSNGGGFVGTLACSELGSRFAAFASVAGSFYTDVDGNGCLTSRSPLPFLEIHGGSDRGVHYSGGIGYGGPLPSIPVWYADTLPSYGSNRFYILRLIWAYLKVELLGREKQMYIQLNDP